MTPEQIRQLVEHFDRITVPEVREAYLYLTHHAESLAQYQCGPGQHGDVRDFRYEQEDAWPFASIVNQKSLLWYFRLAGLKNPAAGVSQLQREFDEVRETPAGEITVRISTLEDAQRMATRVFGS